MAGGDAREGRPGREARAPSKTPSGAAGARRGASVLVRGGLLVDGGGAPARRADLLVQDGLVAAIGDAIKAPEGALVFEAAGAVVSPGFVDAHSHDDAALLEPEGSAAKLSQGVTAVVAGNCGLSLAPWTPSEGRPLPPPPLNLLGGPERFAFGSFAAYLEALRSGAGEGRAPAPRPRAAVLAGHSSLRAARVADLGGPARPAELKDMIRDLEEGLEAGLAGFSGGLAYPASLGAPASEAAALAKAAFSRGKVFALHIRNEYEGMWDALDEAFAIARGALGGSPEPGARLVLSHQKCAGPSNRGRSAELLERVERAARDIPLAFDAYPYEAGSTLLEAESVRASRRVLVTWSEPHPELAGLELGEAAARLGLRAEAAIGELSPAGAAYFHMDGADVEAILSHPLCMVGSDGLPNDARPHPRLYGAFPRFFARFVRERRLLTLEEAVRKASSLPASVFGLPGGVLAPGAPADLVVFRPEAIEAGSDWVEPRGAARGIDLVLVGGAPALGGASLRNPRGR